MLNAIDDLGGDLGPLSWTLIVGSENYFNTLNRDQCCLPIFEDEGDSKISYSACVWVLILLLCSDNCGV